MGTNNMLMVGIIGAVLLMMTMGRGSSRKGPNIAYLKDKRAFDFTNLDTSSPNWQAD